MLVRSTVLAALGAATLLTAGGTTATVVLSASDQGITASSEHSEHAKAGDAHGKSADAGANASQEITAVEAPPCPADVKNHGAYVSSVAKNKAEDAEPGDHGALVSAAAQSDCGKPEGGEGSEESVEESAKNDAAAETGKANASEQGQEGQELGQARGRSADHVPARAAR